MAALCLLGAFTAAAADEPKPAAVDAKRAAEITAAVESAFAAIRTGERDKFVARLDFERMLAEIRRQAAAAGLTVPANLDGPFLRGLRAGLAKVDVSAFGPLAPTSAVVRRVEAADDPAEATAWVRTRTADGNGGRLRLWLRKTGDEWRVFDFEDVDLGVRISPVVMLLLADGQADKRADVIRAAAHMREAGLAVLRQDLDAAFAALEKMQDRPLPASLEPLRIGLKCSVPHAKGDHEACLKQCTLAAVAGIDPPVLDYFRAASNNALGRFDEALTAARRFLKRNGDDDDGWLEAGKALEGLKRPAEAADAFRKGLDEYADSDENFLGLARVLPAGGKAELAERFQKRTDPAKSFVELADALHDAENAEALEVLAGAFRKIRPDDPEADFRLGQAKALRKEVAAAAELFKAAFGRTKDDERRTVYVDTFLGTLLSAGKSLEAYEGAPDPAYAFQHLADQLPDAEAEAAPLRKLVEAHRAKKPDDVWLRYHQARLHVGAKRFDEADRELAAGMKADLSEVAAETFRHFRVATRHQAGKGLSAYAEIGPAGKTFLQLAQLFADDKREAELTELVGLHRKAAPDDKRLPRWEAEAHWLGKRYDAVVKALAGRPRDADDPDAEACDDRLVRSLVRLKRFEDACREGKRSGDNFLHTIALAAGGDAEKAQALIEEGLKAGDFDLEDLYEDPDLGPALRSGRFREFRKKHPDPTPDKKPA